MPANDGEGIVELKKAVYGVPLWVGLYTTIFFVRGETKKDFRFYPSRKIWVEKLHSTT
jgi:hypothetical protein